jgi:hypothetical protein
MLNIPLIGHSFLPFPLTKFTLTFALQRHLELFIFDWVFAELFLLFLEHELCLLSVFSVQDVLLRLRLHHDIHQVS